MIEQTFKITYNDGEEEIFTTQLEAKEYLDRTDNNVYFFETTDKEADIAINEYIEKIESDPTVKKCEAIN